MENILVTIPIQKTNKLYMVAKKLIYATRGEADVHLQYPEDWNPELTVKTDHGYFTITCWERSTGWTYFVTRTIADDVRYCVVHDDVTLAKRIINKKPVGYKKYTQTVR